MKTNQTLYLIIAIAIMVWLLLVCFLPDPKGMFESINSLFSGLALCGAIYSIILQMDSNRLSNYQFRFNHIKDIISKRTDIFNESLNKFTFKDLENNILNFSDGVKCFKNIENADEDCKEFIIRNKEVIESILPLIYHSNKFTHNLIDEEIIISPSDKDKLKDLYFRNQIGSTSDYFSLNKKSWEAEKAEYVSLSEDEKAFRKALYNIRISMIQSISQNNYR